MRSVPPVVVALALVATIVVVATTVFGAEPDPVGTTVAARSSLGGHVTAPAPAETPDRRERSLRLLSNADTYLGAMLREQDSVLRRWPERVNQPLRVYMPPAPGITGWRPGMAAAAQDAFFRWERVADVPIRFTFVHDSTGAEVAVRWITEFPGPRTGQADIVWNRRGWIVRATLTLAVHAPGGDLLEDEAVHTVALHEIGHLLGLGHSDRPDDVMAPTTDVHDLTMRDRNAARLLYQIEPGSLKGN